MGGQKPGKGSKCSGSDGEQGGSKLHGTGSVLDCPFLAEIRDIWGSQPNSWGLAGACKMGDSDQECASMCGEKPMQKLGLILMPPKLWELRLWGPVGVCHWNQPNSSILQGMS